MTDFSSFNSAAEQIFTDIKKLLKKKEESIFIHDQYKIVIIKLSSNLLPEGIKLNEKYYEKVKIEDKKKLVEILMKKFSVEIFKYFERIAGDIYKLVDSIKQEIPHEELGAIEDQAIKNLININLQVIPVTALSHNGFITVKTNGLLEMFSIFTNDENIVKPDVFKKEFMSLLVDFYIKYLMTLKQQKKVILNRLRRQD